MVYKINTYNKNHKGFSFVEVLIAMVVLSVGMIGLVKLHIYITDSNNYSKKRAQAMLILDKKSDDLQHFEVLATTTGKIAFEDIANDAGGIITAGTDSDGFTLSWCVDTNDCNGSAYDGNYYYNATNSQASTTNSLSKPYPDFKRAKIRVSWTDKTGATKFVENEVIISARDPKLSAFVASSTVSLASNPE